MPNNAVLAPVGAPVGAAAPVFPALGSPRLAPLTAPTQVSDVTYVVEAHHDTLRGQRRLSCWVEFDCIHYIEGG